MIKLGRYNDLTEFLPGNITTLKSQAKQLYRLKEYNRALDIYTIINAASPDDPEALSYLGRCEARNGNWPAANRYFESAIEASNKLGKHTWYLFRDWGHMNILAERREDAALHFRLAREHLKIETGEEDDAGILAGEGYAYELAKDFPSAKSKYAEALKRNPFHEFTIDRYATILEREGDYITSEKLRSKLNEYETEFITETVDNLGSMVVIRDEENDW